MKKIMYILFIILLCSFVQATITKQLLIKDSTTSAYITGSKLINYSLVDLATGNVIWNESHTVMVNAGIANVLLGDIVTLENSYFLKPTKWVINIDNGLGIDYNETKYATCYVAEFAKLVNSTNVSGISNYLLRTDHNISYHESLGILTVNNISAINNTDYCMNGVCNGNLLINGNLSIIGSYVNINVTTQNMNGSIVPGVTSLFNLGSSTFKWANIYADTIYGVVDGMYTATNFTADYLAQHTLASHYKIGVLTVDNSSFIQAVKVNNATHSDSTSAVNCNAISGATSDLCLITPSSGNCSVDGSCPNVVYQSEMGITLNTTTQFGGNVSGTYNALILNPCGNDEIYKYSSGKGWICGTDAVGIGGSGDPAPFTNVDGKIITNVTGTITFDSFNFDAIFGNWSKDKSNYYTSVQVDSAISVGVESMNNISIQDVLVLIDNSTVIRTNNLSSYQTEAGAYKKANLTIDYPNIDTDGTDDINTTILASNLVLYAKCQNSSNMSCIGGNLVFNGTVSVTSTDYENSTIIRTPNLTNLQVQNITASGYLIGQPLLGMMGSGIIESTSSNLLSEVNITCSGLTCSYNQFRVRLVVGNSATYAKYCNISAGSTVVSDNAQTVIYIDNNCAVQNTEISNFFNSILPQGGVWDFGNVVAYAGNTELVNGIGLEQRRMMKQRILNFNKNHLSVTNGFSKTTGVFPRFNISEGKYVYLMDIVTASKKDTSLADSVEVIAHNGTSTSWRTFDQVGMNWTYCDNSTAVVSCAEPNKYRRVFFFMLGYNDTTDASGLHQLLPLNSISYSSLASCLDTTTNPLTYTLPSWYTYSAVPIWAYCTQASSSAWDGGWIDLRTTKTTTASTGGIDTSAFVPYSGATSNINTGTYTITTTGGFYGTLYGNWNNSNNYPTDDDLANNLSLYTKAGSVINGTDYQNSTILRTGNITNLPFVYVGSVFNGSSNCSIEGSCSLITYDTELFIGLESMNNISAQDVLSLIDNSTLIRTSNTTWVQNIKVNNATRADNVSAVSCNIITGATSDLCAIVPTGFDASTIDYVNRSMMNTATNLTNYVKCQNSSNMSCIGNNLVFNRTFEDTNSIFSLANWTTQHNSATHGYPFVNVDNNYIKNITGTLTFDASSLNLSLYNKTTDLKNYFDIFYSKDTGIPFIQVDNNYIKNITGTLTFDASSLNLSLYNKTTALTNYYDIRYQAISSIYLNQSSTFGGDVGTTYNDLQLRQDTVGLYELNTTNVTLGGFTNDANYTRNATAISMGNITSPMLCFDAGCTHYIVYNGTAVIMT